MKHKVLITSEESRLDHYLEQGWIVESITPQRVSTGGNSGYYYCGNFCFLLKK